MAFGWLDIQEIAEALADKYPQQDPLSVGFTDLQQRVCLLDGFEGEINACNERILEAIVLAWSQEYD